ncbi:hypothetical protein OA90_27440 [Labrenzia sp. OB1]|nr:hypothetical protein OA90_27440 [Labrenzia sp. OB1]
MDRIRSFFERIFCRCICQGADVDEPNVLNTPARPSEEAAKNVLDILSKSDYGDHEHYNFSDAVELLSTLLAPVDIKQRWEGHLYLTSAEHFDKFGRYLTKAFNELPEGKVTQIRFNLRRISLLVNRMNSFDYHSKLRKLCLQTVEELCSPPNREPSSIGYLDFRKTSEAERKHELYERKYWNSTPEEAANTILEMLIAGDFNSKKVARMELWTASMSWMLVDKTSEEYQEPRIPPKEKTREQTIDYFSRALVGIPKDKVEAILISLEAEDLRETFPMDVDDIFLLQTIKDICNSYDEIVANSRKISQAKGNDDDEKSDEPVMRATPEDRSDHERLEMLSGRFSTY